MFSLEDLPILLTTPGFVRFMRCCGRDTGKGRSKVDLNNLEKFVLKIYIVSIDRDGLVSLLRVTVDSDYYYHPYFFFPSSLKQNNELFETKYQILAS